MLSRWWTHSSKSTPTTLSILCWPFSEWKIPVGMVSYVQKISSVTFQTSSWWLIDVSRTSTGRGAPKGILLIIMKAYLGQEAKSLYKYIFTCNNHKIPKDSIKEELKTALDSALWLFKIFSSKTWKRGLSICNAQWWRCGKKYKLVWFTRKFLGSYTPFIKSVLSNITNVFVKNAFWNSCVR